MKSYIFKVSLLAVSLFSSGVVCAGDDKVCADVQSAKTEEKNRYERTIEHREERWSNMMPHYLKLQFAGGMGLLSAGVGWDYGKKKQWETDLLLGFVPRFSGTHTTATFTVKQNYIPWRVRLSDKWTLEPLETGLYMNRIFASDLWTREPEKYGGPYYRFATNIRFSIFLGQRLTVKLPDKIARQSLTLFYELSSNDLYIISAFTNKTINLYDIMVLSFGLKFQPR